MSELLLSGDKVSSIQHYTSNPSVPRLPHINPHTLDRGSIPETTVSFVRPRYSAALSSGILSYTLPNKPNVRSCQIPDPANLADIPKQSERPKGTFIVNDHGRERVLKHDLATLNLCNNSIKPLIIPSPRPLKEGQYVLNRGRVLHCRWRSHVRCFSTGSDTSMLDGADVGGKGKGEGRGGEGTVGFGGGGRG